MSACEDDDALADGASAADFDDAREMDGGCSCDCCCKQTAPVPACTKQCSASAGNEAIAARSDVSRCTELPRIRPAAHPNTGQRLAVCTYEARAS